MCHGECGPLLNRVEVVQRRLHLTAKKTKKNRHAAHKHVKRGAHFEVDSLLLLVQRNTERQYKRSFKKELAQSTTLVHGIWTSRPGRNV